MNKRIFLLVATVAMSMAVMAQRFTDRLDRGLVAVPDGSTSGSTSNMVTWRRLTTEQYGVTYNLYKNGSKVASNLTTTCYSDSKSAPPTTRYQVAAVVNGVEQTPCAAVTPWKQYVYKYTERCATGYLDIDLAPVYDRDGQDVTSHYEPNDAEMADLDGDGQLEIIIKRLNTVDASAQTVTRNGSSVTECYPDESKEFIVFDAYDVNWQTGAATLLWRIDLGPNMVSLNSTEVDIIAYDWDEDGRAEVVLRGADNMIVYGSDGKTQIFTVGDMTANYRDLFSSDDWQYCWSCFGREYLIYMNGLTGEKYQVIDYPLPRLEQSEWPSGITYNDYATLKKNSSQTTTYFKKNSGTLHKAWGDNYGHRSSKYFFGAPFLDGRKASLFLGRGIYTRHKMIAMDLDSVSHQWTERWRWNCNNSSSPWYGNGYHNFIVADVDEDGRDEIVYGSMTIDDNGKGLSTTGYEHGDAQHVSDFDPYRKGLEFFGCLEDGPYYGCNYRNATTGEVYFKHTSTKDDGRALMANFSNDYPGSVGRSSSASGMIASLRNNTTIDAYAGDSYINWGDLNARIYWDGDLCSEILNSPGTAKEASVEKPGTGRLFTSSGCNMNNDSKNNPCFQGDIIGDWREEIVVRRGTGLRVYTTGMWTTYSLPTLWNDHQYRQAMVWQMMAYNQPPHLSYFLGEMEGITTAPPTLTNDGRTEVADGGTISTTTDQLLMCETNDMTVNVEDGASPALLVVNAPTWVQGTDVNGTSATKVRSGAVGARNLPAINTTTYTHRLTGGAFAGKMRLVKQGDGILELPDVEQTYTGQTDVWAGTLRFDGTLTKSPLWLNRHTTLETSGGNFQGSITADYGSPIAVGSEGLTTNKLSLNHGARLVITLRNDITATQVNATTVVANAKSGDAWEQYGPEYLKPVVEFRAESGSVASGTYDLGTIAGFLDKVVVEGLDDAGEYSFESADGHLYLIVGSGEAVSCPEATFAVSGYHPTDEGLLPVVSIEPGTFTYAGSDVTPTIAATFNDEPVDLLTLYNEDFEGSTNPADYWKNNNSAFIYSPSYPGSDGQCVSITSNADRGDYVPFSANYAGVSKYAIEFDSYFNNASKTTDFVVMSSSHWDSWHYNYGYNWKTTSIYDHNAYLLFLQRGPGSTTFTINETDKTITLDNSKWYHFMLDVDMVEKVVNYTICQKGSTEPVATGTYNLPQGESAECDGIFVRNGRYQYEPGGAGIDNISIYRTDGATFAFPTTGTLTVTTSYPGCQSATASYSATEAIMAGDVNGDGVVNIVDVAQTISYITGTEPEGFKKAAADTDGNGTVDQADVKAIVGLIGWK